MTIKCRYLTNGQKKENRNNLEFYCHLFLPSKSTIMYQRFREPKPFIREAEWWWWSINHKNTLRFRGPLTVPLSLSLSNTLYSLSNTLYSLSLSLKLSFSFYLINTNSLSLSYSFSYSLLPILRLSHTPMNPTSISDSDCSCLFSLSLTPSLSFFLVCSLYRSLFIWQLCTCFMSSSFGCFLM